MGVLEESIETWLLSSRVWNSSRPPLPEALWSLSTFFATWCGPCKMIAPKLESMSKEMAGKVVFLKIDVDELDDLAAKQEVKAMPTFSFFKNGQKLESFAGANEQKIRETIEKHL